MRKGKGIVKTIAALSLVSLIFNSEVLYADAGYKTDLSNAVMIDDGTGEFYDELDELLWSLPEYVQDTITPFTITIVGDDAYIEHRYEQYRYSSVVGLTDFDTFEIFVESYIDDSYADTLGGHYSNYEYSKRFSQTILLHEIGHVMDNAFGMASYNKDFGNIYYAEVYDFMDSEFFYTYEVGDKGGVYNSEEYFCTAYACYILRPDLLLETCPQTYDYIREQERAYLNTYGYDDSSALPQSNGKSKSEEEKVYTVVENKLSRLIFYFARLRVEPSQYF